MLSVIIQQIITGFFVKSVASFDDTLTRIPILLELTRTKKGKVAFSFGTLLAVTVVVIIAIFFSSLLDLIPYKNQVIAGLIFLLALGVYFEIFSSKPKKKVEEKVIRADTFRSRLPKLIFVGFLISFITLLDDMIVLIPLFLGDNFSRFYSLIGVYLATIIQILIVIYFSSRIGRIKYKKEVASLALVFLSVLVAIGVV